MGFATPCTSGVYMGLVIHLLSQTNHMRQKEHMLSGTKGASTVQIPGSPRVSTTNMGLLWGHRALQPKGTALDNPYLAFLSLANPH